MYICIWVGVHIYIYIKESLGAPTEQVMSEENMVR